jgi:hypothetical protein
VALAVEERFRMRATIRQSLAVLGFSLVIASSTLVEGSPASAQPGTVTCLLGTAVLTFDPPLTNTEKTTDISVHRELGACVSTARPDITTGTSDFHATGPAGCTRIFVETPMIATILWTSTLTGTTETSTLDVTAIANIVQGQLVTTFTGEVTAGVFVGGAFQWVLTVPSAGLVLCSTTTGVSSMSGSLTTQITVTS